MADEATTLDAPKPNAIPGVHPNGDIDWPLVFPLRKPITALDKEYSQISLKEPLAMHIVKYELLSKSVTEENVAGLVSELSDIPVASLQKMTAADLMKLTVVLARFFYQAAE